MCFFGKDSFAFVVYTMAKTNSEMGDFETVSKAGIPFVRSSGNDRRDIHVHVHVHLNSDSKENGKDGYVGALYEAAGSSQDSSANRFVRRVVFQNSSDVGHDNSRVVNEGPQFKLADSTVFHLRGCQHIKHFQEWCH